MEEVGDRLGVTKSAPAPSPPLTAWAGGGRRRTHAQTALGGEVVGANPALLDGGAQLLPGRRALTSTGSTPNGGGLEHSPSSPPSQASASRVRRT